VPESHATVSVRKNLTRQKFCRADVAEFSALPYFGSTGATNSVSDLPFENGMCSIGATNSVTESQTTVSVAAVRGILPDGR